MILSKPGKYNKKYWLVGIIVMQFITTIRLHAQTLNKSYPAESLEIRLNKIADDSGVNISFDSNLIKGINVPAYNAKNQQWDKVLTNTLSATQFTYTKVSGKSYAIIKKVAPAKKKKPGSIKGSVIDSQGQSLPGASIHIIETADFIESDLNGNYSVSLEPGSYTVEISFISFQTQRITGVEVKENDVTFLNVVLKDDTKSLEEVVITINYDEASAAGLYAKQRKSIAITDGISAEQMLQTPDNNVAQVLKRVAGVTIQENKFVVVRGMSERYNNVQLNGSSLPSTEPNRRNFSFDVIPSNLVDNIVVAKTFTPDMSGEFSGGTVQISTLSIPDNKFLTLSIGNGFNTKSFGKDLWGNTRYAGDYFLGTDKRDWNKNNWTERYVAAYDDPQRRGEIAAEIPNHWGLQKYTGGPTQNIAVSGGIPFKLSEDSSLGIIGGITYRHEENREDYDWQSRFFPVSAYDGIRSTFVTSAAAMLNAGWKNSRNNINWRNLYNRRFTHDNSRETDVDTLMSEGEYEKYQYRIVSSVRENVVWQTRLEGEHKFLNNKLTATWFGDFNDLQRDQPDDRFNKAYVYGTTADGVPVYDWFTSRPSQPQSLDGNGVFASKLNEKKWNAGGNLEYAFDVAGNKQILKTGYWGTFRSADYNQTILRIFETIDEPNILPLQELFSTQNFLDGKYYYNRITYQAQTSIEPSADPDGYSGHQNINAAYVMGNFTMFNKLHLIGGVRMEDSKMDVNTVTAVLTEEGRTWKDSTVVYRENKLLPSANIIYDLLDKFKIRAAYSQTLARADFRERSSFRYYDLWERTMVIGSEGLEDAFSDNYDLRFEWYPAPGEIISLSAFYKDLTKPVEIIAIPSSTGEDLANYFNLDKAAVKGIELNLRKSFGFITESLSKLFFTANATLMDGWVRLQPASVDEVEVEGGNRDRLPNGLAPLSYNTGLLWDGDKVGAAVNYNYVGYRITYAGSDEFRDQYQAARGTLDAQLSFKLMKDKMELRFNAADILAKPFVDYRNAYEIIDNGTAEGYKKAINGKGYDEGEDTIIRKGWNGTTYSFTLAYTF